MDQVCFRNPATGDAVVHGAQHVVTHQRQEVPPGTCAACSKAAGVGRLCPVHSQSGGTQLGSEQVQVVAQFDSGGGLIWWLRARHSSVAGCAQQ